MKKNFLLLGLGLMASLSSFAQVLSTSNAALARMAVVKNSSGWIQFKPEARVSAADVFTVNKAAFNLGAGDAMKVTKMEADLNGLTHTRYQQTYQGVPVAGAEYIVHDIQGIAHTANGKLVTGLNCTVVPSVSADAAINKAIGFIGAQKYMWEDEANERMLKHITENAGATYYPKAELVIFDKDYSGIAANYRLAWKINVYAGVPLSYQDVYIDAASGDVFYVANRLRNDNVNGVAHTKYSGVQNIITDSVAVGSYRLRETGRGAGIETYNMLTGTDYGAAVDFTDADNNWNNVNPLLDEVATDAHWGAEMTYDYFFTKHGRSSYDNAGSKLVSFVHYDVNYENAFWDGTRMTYGDGSTSYSPFTSLDVCGHEISHGVTEYTAALIYQDEPGALNESFSDMFSAAIEFYALNGAGDWLVGEDFDVSGNGFRNMSNPNEDGQPDTYLGDNWYVGDLDYGGVHYNSGVGNYWFYLLSEGGSGTNDNGRYFSVSGLGIDTAAQIAYRALTLYMTSTAQYIDCRMATMQAAIDLFGICSNAYIQCANSWYAVGVGMAVSDNDFSMNRVLSPVTACGLNIEPLKVELVYNGCSATVPAGDTLTFAYSFDGGPDVNDTLILATAVQPGDTLDFTFSVPVDASVLGNHTIAVSCNYNNDTLDYNDELTDFIFENKLYQNIDVGITSVKEPVSSCDLSNSEVVKVEWAFFGCDFLPSGSVVRLGYNVNGGSEIIDSMVLVSDLYPGTSNTFIFNVPADLSSAGTHVLNVWTAFAEDTLRENDSIVGYAVKKPMALSDTIVTFDETGTDALFLAHTTAYSHAFVSTQAENTGTKGFLMTGGNAMTYMNMIELPDGFNTWQTNEFLSAKIDFCVDATAWSTAHVAFDLKQTFGKAAYEYVIGPGNYTIASNFRVLVNGTNQIGGTYNPVTANSDPYNPRFVDLSAYAGTYFTLTFETRNLSADTLMFTMDNAYLDNIRISEASQVGVENGGILQNVGVSPNPSHGLFWGEYTAEKSEQVLTEVFDYTGKKVYGCSTEVLTGLNRIRIDLSDQPHGIYMLRLSTNEKASTAKIILE